MTRSHRALRWLPPLALLCLAGCDFSPPLSASDRETLDGCRRDADRVYDTQNRYQLSERDSRDSPFSSSGAAATPNAGLADQYVHAREVDDCVRRGGTTPGNAAPESPAAGVPPQAPTNQPAP